MLAAGCDDLGGTLMEETISRMAGSENGSRRSVRELEELAGSAGRPARQRTTTYGPVAGRAQGRRPAPGPPRRGRCGVTFTGAQVTSR